MLLLEVESRVFEQFLRAGVAPAEADGLRRLVPIRRDQFDNFLFTATRVAVGEGTWSSFTAACLGYLSGNLQSVPPLIPPDVAGAVGEILSQFRRKQPTDRLVEGLDGCITEHQHRLAERLFYELGGDLGDGLKAAGLRVYSKMMSARISDGFIHPAIGGHLWGDVQAASAYHRPDSGRSITVLRTIDALSRSWRTTPADRPTVERLIIDHAHTLGWRNEAPE